MLACKTRDESKRINNMEGAKVVIAASGMMNGGRVLHHALRILPDENATVVFVGYQAAGTLGRRVADGEKQVKVLGQWIPVRARIEKIGGFSAHADWKEVLRWLDGFACTAEESVSSRTANRTLPQRWRTKFANDSDGRLKCRSTARDSNLSDAAGLAESMLSSHPVRLSPPKLFGLLIVSFTLIMSALAASLLDGPRFHPGPSLAAGKEPVAVVTADFNADGRADLAVANNGSDNVSIFVADGSGGFNPATYYPTGKRPRALAAADFNRDTYVDLVVANNSSNNLSLLAGDGKGRFTSAGSIAVGAGPMALAVADFNGDGRADIATANAKSNNVSILLSDGGGGFATPLDFAVGVEPFSLAAVDQNGDTQS